MGAPEGDAIEILYKPIGLYHSDQVHPYEAGRQPDALHAPGVIELEKGRQFEPALKGLEGFSHLWVIFQFHHNENWKPLVQPPRGSQEKQGVFATRSPYRPNNIGLSVVRLLRVEGLKIFVAEADLLDQSPILDIKPYLAYADSHPEASLGWIQEEEKFTVAFTPEAEARLQFLESQGLNQIRPFLHHQLEYDPYNKKKKRVQEQSPHQWVLAYRTWRALFQGEGQSLKILTLYSGYDSTELKKKEDPYLDKDLHRQFLQIFKN